MSRWLRLLLLCYPEAFRHRFGAPLVQTCLDDLQADRRGSRWLFWRRAAVLSFCLGLEGVRERWREERERQADRQLRRRTPMDRGWANDVRATARAMCKRWRYFLGTASILGLGIGAATAVFTVTDHVVLRPLAFPHAARLVSLSTHFDELSFSSNSLPNLLDVRRQTGGLELLTAAAGQSPVLTDWGEPKRLSALRVTEDYFPAVGARVVLGRGFVAADFVNGAAPSVVISYSLWQGHLGADRAAIGRDLRLDGRLYQIVGVVDPRFRDPKPMESGSRTEAWIPLREGDEAFAERGSYLLTALARLKDGTRIEELNAELATVSARLAAEYPEDNQFRGPMRIVASSLHETSVGELRARLVLFLCAAGLLLLVSCAHAGSLFVVRGIGRIQEMKLRSALGAARSRLVRQVLLEAFAISVAAALLGCGLASGAIRSFRSLAPAGLPRLDEVTIDLRVLVFAVIVASFCALLFGTLPALRLGKEVYEVGSTRATSGRWQRRSLQALTVATSAIAVTLVASFALVAHGLWRMLEDDLGYDAKGVSVLQLRPRVVELEGRSEDREERRVRELAFYEEVLAHLQALPTVESAAAANTLPAVAHGTWIRLPQSAEPNAPTALFRQNAVSAEYFSILGIRLVEGRSLAQATSEGCRDCAVVNQAAAHLLWGSSGALGKKTFSREPWTIVGVVEDTRQRGWGAEFEPEIFIDIRTTSHLGLGFVIAERDGKASFLTG